MVPTFKIREFEYASAEYRAEVALREEILRAPLGLKLTPEELALDVGDTHLGAFAGDELIGCMILKTVSPDVICMRQVAARAQGNGVGKAMVEFAEALARARGAKEIVLHGRESAVGFYTRMGYSIQSGPVVERTGPHYEMFKKL